MIRVTKDVLRQLNAAAGKLDTDSGKVFEQFIGRFDMSDRLFHGELHFADAGDEPPEEKVSIQTIISPAEAAKSAYPVNITEKQEI